MPWVREADKVEFTTVCLIPYVNYTQQCSIVMFFFPVKILIIVTSFTLPYPLPTPVHHPTLMLCLL